MYADRVEVGWERRVSPARGDTRRTQKTPLLEAERSDRSENLSLWYCPLSSKTRKEYQRKDPKGMPHHVLKF